MARKQITFFVTSDEADTLKTLVGNGNQSEYLRGLIRRDAAERGIDWPENALHDTRGQHVARNERGRFVSPQQCQRCAGWNIGMMAGQMICADCGWAEGDRDGT